MNTQSAQYLIEGLLGVALVALMIWRQVGERQWSVRRLIMFPAIFLLIAVLNGRDLGHELAPAMAKVMLVVGLVLAVALGLARAHTMKIVRREGTTIVTRGTKWTMLWWGISIATRIGAAVAASTVLHLHEGIAQAMLFVAVTIGVQNLWLARRGGLLGSAPAAA